MIDVFTYGLNNKDLLVVIATINPQWVLFLFTSLVKINHCVNKNLHARNKYET